jgi:hypothetical protein
VQDKLSRVEADLQTRDKLVAVLQGQAAAAKEQQVALQAQIDKLQACPVHLQEHGMDPMYM